MGATKFGGHIKNEGVAAPKYHQWPLACPLYGRKLPY